MNYDDNGADGDEGDDDANDDDDDDDDMEMRCSGGYFTTGSRWCRHCLVTEKNIALRKKGHLVTYSTDSAK